MSAQPAIRLLPQVILLLVALAGWTAFAAAFFGHIRANQEISRLQEEAEEIMRMSDKAHEEKDRLIDLLRIRVDQLESRLGASPDSAKRDRKGER